MSFEDAFLMRLNFPVFLTYTDGMAGPLPKLADDLYPVSTPLIA